MLKREPTAAAAGSSPPVNHLGLLLCRPNSSWVIVNFCSCCNIWVISVSVCLTTSTSTNQQFLYLFDPNNWHSGLLKCFPIVYDLTGTLASLASRNARVFRWRHPVWPKCPSSHWAYCPFQGPESGLWLSSNRPASCVCPPSDCRPQIALCVWPDSCLKSWSHCASTTEGRRKNWDAHNWSRCKWPVGVWSRQWFQSIGRTGVPAWTVGVHMVCHGATPHPHQHGQLCA